MNKPNRFLAAVALSGAALAVAAAPAQAAGGLLPGGGPVGTPGGLFGAAAFTLAELTSGMQMPDTDQMIENAKNSPQGQAQMQKQQAH